jgi:hypothetical protein
MIAARDNPFASHRVEALKYRFPGFSFGEVLNRLEQQSWRGSILGQHGAGKTTLLIEIHAALQQRFGDQRLAHLWFVPRNRPQQSLEWRSLSETLTSTSILMVDGIERLGWFARQRLLGFVPSGVGSTDRITRSIIATTHRRLGLPIAARCSTKVEVMCELLYELYPSAPEAMILRSHQLFQQCRGNVRDVFWGLFDEAGKSHDS